MKRVLIAGAGIIGLSTALELAAHGVDVTVLERGTAMREASWAAAGMLAANDPENPLQLAPLAQLSLSLYAAFLRHIERLSADHVPLRTKHTLQLCRPDHIPEGVASLSFAEAAGRVPGLGTAVGENCIWLEESSLDPRDLCRALPIAARAAGVRIVENCSLNFIHTAHDGVTAITPERRYEADALVLCCGAWSQRNWTSQNWSIATADRPMDPSDAGLCIPRKGQMLSVRMPARHLPRLETVLRSPEIYVVPRGPASGDSDRIIVGATVEEAGFDRAIRSDATAWLLHRAAALWPPIREAQLEEVWTGIRPGTLDDLPLIGPVAMESSARWEASRLWLATGHYRNGILLAPGTARVVASSLLADRMQSSLIDMTPFQPSRFQGAVEPLIREETQSVIL